PVLDCPMVYSAPRDAEGVLRQLAAAPCIKTLGLQYSAGWHEPADKKKGCFDTQWAVPSSWDDVILQGPHFGVANPFAKQPNPTLKHNQDWSEIDLEAMPPDFIPATAYQPNRDDPSLNYDDAYTHWTNGNSREADRNSFRFLWRKMAATTGYRTLYISLIPKSAAIVGAAISARDRKSVV